MEMLHTADVKTADGSLPFQQSNVTTSAAVKPDESNSKLESKQNKKEFFTAYASHLRV